MTLICLRLICQQVELSYGQPDRRRKLLVNFYLQGNESGVIVTAYASQLRNELDAFQDGLTLLVEFGNRWIWSEGDSRDAQRPSQSEFFATALSAKYGYRVKGGYAQGYTAQEIRQSMLQILPSLVLVGTVTGLIVYLGLFRHAPAGEIGPPMLHEGGATQRVSVGAQHTAAYLVTFDGFEQRLEVAFTKAIVTFALDELEEHRPSRVSEKICNNRRLSSGCEAPSRRMPRACNWSTGSP